MGTTVLVLGAGASLPYGYPLGGELRQKILRVNHRSIFIPRGNQQLMDVINGQALDKFREAFQLSQMNSIDAFLGRRPDFQELGKKCIASVLLECERPSNLFSEGLDKDHWYKYLFNRFAKNDWDDLSFEGIAIVTFNYDRSLQHFLYHAIKNTYNRSGDEVREKLKSLRIVHVYGALSDKFPGEENDIEYDGTVSPGKVEMAAKGLVVIPEGRIDSATLVQAREWLLEADKIGFLGFGFDETNVARLAEGGACRRTVQRPDAMYIRGIQGTRIGMFDSELRRALRLLEGKDDPNVQAFHDRNCTDTLRITQLIDS